MRSTEFSRAQFVVGLGKRKKDIIKREREKTLLMKKRENLNFTHFLSLLTSITLILIILSLLRTIRGPL